MQGEAEPDLSELWRLAAQKFALGEDSLHGPAHWRRVYRNAETIAAATSGADLSVVRLFGILHDACRENEGHDPDHGQRAAMWARELNGTSFTISEKQLDTLTEALIWHDRGKVSGDPTIGTCWDADRLDLPRVGIEPVKRLMSTAYGKSQAKDD